MHSERTDKHVVIVAGGFAGLGCARALARRRGSAKESRPPAETTTHCEESVVVKKKSVASLSPGPQWRSRARQTR